MMEWISVKDRLPETYFFVLVYSKMPGTNEPSPITIARWNGDRWETLCNEEENNACASGDLFWATDSDEITHWIPLPLPPKEENPYISPLSSWVCKSCGKWELKGSQMTIYGKCPKCLTENTALFESKDE